MPAGPRKCVLRVLVVAFFGLVVRLGAFVAYVFLLFVVQRAHIR